MATYRKQLIDAVKAADKLTKQSKERLKQVVRVLRELPPEKKFDMTLWLKCGTVGCAIGWAGSDPWFTKHSFKMVTTVITRQKTKNYEPEYKNHVGSGAVMKFFNLDRQSVRHLFMSGSYNKNVRQGTVIKRIERFIKEH